MHKPSGDPAGPSAVYPTHIPVLGTCHSPIHSPHNGGWRRVLSIEPMGKQHCTKVQFPSFSELFIMAPFWIQSESKSQSQMHGMNGSKRNIVVVDDDPA